MTTDDHDLLIKLTGAVDDVKEDVHGLKELFEQYVTQREFGPVRLIAFGLVSAIVSGVLFAVVSLVLRAGGP